MSSFCVWTIVVILYQTVISVTVSWLTLECRLSPNYGEPHELTLMKLLYLYDPKACGRRQFYNQTVTYIDEISKRSIALTTIVWLETNGIAEGFRQKIKFWMGLHLVWLALALANASQGRRVCAFYAVLLPLTAAGLALLVSDVVNAALFLRDAARTSTEEQILEYIRMCSVVNSIQQSAAVDYTMLPLARQEDTAWVALVFAYASCRGVVQWIINFWIVQDNFLDGLEFYRSMITRRGGERDKMLKGNQNAA